VNAKPSSVKTAPLSLAVTVAFGKNARFASKRIPSVADGVDVVVESYAAVSPACGLWQRLGCDLLGRLAEVFVDGLADDPVRQLVEVGMQFFG